jgi:putative holliday junction resolvase
MTELGRVMALDVGDARVGVALSDSLRITAQPHTTIERNRSAGSAIADILGIIIEYDVREVVIGLPMDLKGRIGQQAQKVLAFKAELEMAAGKAGSKALFSLLDERFTTEEAKRIVVGSKLKNRKQSAALDRVSAALILHSFLNRR